MEKKTKQPLLLQRIVFMGETMKFYEEELFENLKLEGEHLAELQFTDCRFDHCQFLDLSLHNCSFINCEFRHCITGNPKLKFTDMVECRFYDSMLVGIDWKVMERKTAKILPFSLFQDCVMKYNYFTKLPLKRFDFSQMKMEDCIFEECDMSEASFNGASLNETKFLNCKLLKADFRNAEGYAVDLKSCPVKGARFTFPEVVNLLRTFEIKIE